MKPVVVILALAVTGSVACKDKSKTPSSEPGAATSGSSAASEQPAPSSSATEAERLEALAKVASCDSQMPFCFPIDRWSEGSAAELPTSRPYLVGVSVNLAPGIDAEAAVKEYYTMAILAVKQDDQGARLGLRRIRPNNETEKRVMDGAIRSIGKVTRGEQTSAQVPGMLIQYLDKRAAEVKPKAANKDGQQWRFDGQFPVRLRRIGNVWVAIESKDGAPTSSVYVSVFPIPGAGAGDQKDPAETKTDGSEKPSE